VIIAALSWDTFFTSFHSIFFASGTWQFEYSDTLIRLFPEQFWFDAAVTIGALTILGASLFWLISRRYLAQVEL
jgi:integral membrane protein (TIGR01906 family)